MTFLPRIHKENYLLLLSTFVLFLSVFVGVSLVAKQQEVREAAAAGPSAVSTFHSIGLYWSPSGGSASNSAQVQYRKKDTTIWRQGLDLWFDSGDGEYRGSLVHLEPTTTYEIKLTLKNSGTTATFTATTWSENFPVAKTIELPKSSNKTLVIDQSGSPNGYILYTYAPGSSATIDGGSNNIEVSASYVIIRGLTLKNAGSNAIWLNDNLNDIVIEENDISGWGSGSNYDSAVRSRDAPGLKRVIVQRNRMHNPRSGSNNWSTGHPKGPQAVTLFNSGGNHVIRYNEVYSDKDHYFNDVLGAGSNFSKEGFPNRDSDIYGNYLADCWDDAIEVEGGNRNVRVWGNFIENCYVAIANRSTTVGPLYIWRNIFGLAELNYFKHDPTTDERRGRFLKAGGPARTYLFHNTVLQPPPTGGFKYPMGASAGIEGSLKQSVTRNNIFQVNRPDLSGGWHNSISGDSSNDFDYDLYNGNVSGSGQEVNGVKGVPKYNPVPSYSLLGGKGIFTLDSGSPGFDAGAILPNFNDGYTGSRPDMGAHEAGTPPMEFGVDAYRTGPPQPPSLPGDIDKDGDVDIFDYNLMIENFGNTNCGNVSDINRDCKVDIFDYNILTENFGRSR